MGNNLFGEPLFKNTVVVEPRELLPFNEGEGTLQRCIGRYIQKEIKKCGKRRETLNLYCSHVTAEEQSFFENVLFNLLFDSEYLYNTELYIILEEFSKLVDMTDEEICNILNGFPMIKIDIRDEGFLTRSPFPGSETGNCFNTETEDYDSEDHYYALQISPDFLKACSEIKAEMG